MKRCPRCASQGREELHQLTDFGVCRERKDGLNLYCRQCTREKVAIQRTKLKEYKLVVKRRKPNVKAGPIWRLNISNVEKVKLAFARGITDRGAIRQATRIYWDDLVDILAVLNDQGEIKWNPKRQVFQLAA